MKKLKARNERPENGLESVENEALIVEEGDIDGYK